MATPNRSIGDLYTPLGIGHPNIVIQKDYGGDNVWYARLETMVPIDEKDLPQVESWFSNLPADALPAAKFLCGKVPSGKGNQLDAQRMVAATFGFGYSEQKGVVPADTISPSRTPAPTADRSAPPPA